MIERTTINRHGGGAIAATVEVRGAFAGVMQAAGLVLKIWTAHFSSHRLSHVIFDSVARDFARRVANCSPGRGVRSIEIGRREIPE